MKKTIDSSRKQDNFTGPTRTRFKIPAKTPTKTPAISAGDRVEVLGREDGFLGSYFTARVIRKVDKTRLIVEYETLLSDEDETQFVTEVVDLAAVRPVPEPAPAPEFEVMEKVDVFDNEGWWVGRVTGVFGDKYSVFFDSSGDEILYDGDLLRAHQEWAMGVWVPSFNNKIK